MRTTLPAQTAWDASSRDLSFYSLLFFLCGGISGEGNEASLKGVICRNARENLGDDVADAWEKNRIDVISEFHLKLRPWLITFFYESLPMFLVHSKP